MCLMSWVGGEFLKIVFVSTLNKLVEIGLVEYSSDGYMITDEGEAVALGS